jgi:alkylhydroperoxidase family enzyme
MTESADAPRRIEPLSPEYSPELGPEFSSFLTTLGFVPNSVLIMQRKPELVRAFVAMQRAIWAPNSKVDRGFKRLVAHVASRASRDPYSMAHTASGALHFGVDAEKLAAAANYRASPLYSAAEKAALDVAVAANTTSVSDTEFTELRRHWSDEEIVEIVATIAMAGFLSRWNGIMATPLEDEALAVAEEDLRPRGWSPGRHGPVRLLQTHR